MKKLILLLVVLFLHVEAKDDTQVGTFDSGVSSEKPKKRLKSDIQEAQSFSVDINDSEVEGISKETPKKEEIEQKPEEIKIEKVKEESELIKIEKAETTNNEPIKSQTSKSDVVQKDSGGVVLPFDKVDEKSGVVLPMDEEKKGGFFSIFGF
jgi:hypothetical protein